MGGHSGILGKPYTGAFSTVDSSVKFEGVAYPLAKHGFARKREFTLIDSIADTLVYELRDNEETKKLYPCSFSFTATHKITDEVFTTTFKVKNADNKPIWFCIGGHPGFRCPMNDGEKFSDYKLVFEKVENEDVIYTTNYGGGYIDASLPVVDKLKNTNEWDLCHDDYDVDVLLTKKLQSRKVKLVHKVIGKGIELS